MGDFDDSGNDGAYNGVDYDGNSCSDGARNGVDDDDGSCIDGARNGVSDDDDSCSDDVNPKIKRFHYNGKLSIERFKVMQPVESFPSWRIGVITLSNF